MINKWFATSQTEAYSSVHSVNCKLVDQAINGKTESE